MGPITHQKFRFNSFFFYVSYFIQESTWIHHHTVADNTGRASIHDTRRDEVEFKGVAIDDDGMAGIITTVESYNVVGFTSKKISDFPFAFVTPLSTNNYRDLRWVGRHFVAWFGLAGWRLMSLKKKYGWKVYN